MTDKPVWWYLCLAALAVVLLAMPHLGSAHPLGNFSISHYTAIRLDSDAVVLRYLIDMAEIPTFQCCRKDIRACRPISRNGSMTCAPVLSWSSTVCVYPSVPKVAWTNNLLSRLCLQCCARYRSNNVCPS